MSVQAISLGRCVFQLIHQSSANCVVILLTWRERKNLRCACSCRCLGHFIKESHNIDILGLKISFFTIPPSTRRYRFMAHGIQDVSATSRVVLCLWADKEQIHIWILFWFLVMGR